jgi:hypothetical protein
MKSTGRGTRTEASNPTGDEGSGDGGEDNGSVDFGPDGPVD